MLICSSLIIDKIIPMRTNQNSLNHIEGIVERIKALRKHIIQ